MKFFLAEAAALADASDEKHDVQRGRCASYRCAPISFEISYPLKRAKEENTKNLKMTRADKRLSKGHKKISVAEKDGPAGMFAESCASEIMVGWSSEPTIWTHYPTLSKDTSSLPVDQPQPSKNISIVSEISEDTLEIDKDLVSITKYKSDSIT